MCSQRSCATAMSDFLQFGTCIILGCDVLLFPVWELCIGLGKVNVFDISIQRKKRNSLASCQHSVRQVLRRSTPNTSRRLDSS
uniref:Uncharacterized protein n=1 Tax=Oryza brachyantha TaxID=4533 RepID=J3LHE4_ORYBR